MELVYEVHPAGTLGLGVGLGAGDGLGLSEGLVVAAGVRDAAGDADDPVAPHAATHPIMGIARQPAMREKTAGVTNVALCFWTRPR